jgi:hypothetical protein
VLGSIDASAFHKIGPDNTMMATKTSHPLPPELAAAQDAMPGVFLVQHDWASLMARADVDQGGYRLPFDYCCFEFSISGRHVCALVASDRGEPYRLIPFIRAVGGWLIMQSFAMRDGVLTPEGGECHDDTPSLSALLASQIRAIAITLDAEVVQTELMRAPEALNVARLKRNERPIYDHHILRLARRDRPAPLSVHSPGSHRRLHFRRGHWRRYPSHKTWIRWCLVGDPALGFADKDYRL